MAEFAKESDVPLRSPAERTAGARSAARAAARQARVRVRDVRDTDGFRDMCRLYRRVWQEDPDSPAVTPVLLQALAHSGNYVCGAYRGDLLLGACVGFLSASSPGELHSHITGVTAEARGHKVGFAVKLHQRAWALDRGITRITWTFDPLVRRNAYFNLTKLGATPRAYLTNFYGDMADGINGGDETDRLAAEWRLDDERVAGASAGRPVEPDPEALLAAGAAIALGTDPAGRPVVGRTDTVVLLVAVPSDVERLRGADPSAAAGWRLAVRETLGGLIGEGAVVTGFARSGWYVVERRGI